MKELTLNAAGWQSKDDVYDSFFRAVGAPARGMEETWMRIMTASGPGKSIRLKCRTD
jgi:hypothetical protein